MVCTTFQRNPVSLIFNSNIIRNIPKEESSTAWSRWRLYYIPFTFRFSMQMVRTRLTWWVYGWFYGGYLYRYGNMLLLSGYSYICLITVCWTFLFADKTLLQKNQTVKFFCRFFRLSKVRSSEHTENNLMPKSTPNAQSPCTEFAGTSWISVYLSDNTSQTINNLLIYIKLSNNFNKEAYP